MRWLGLLLVWCISSDGLAAQLFLIPENTPKPVYPRALHRAGINGEVRVGFTVQADGSVSGVRILQSVHPDLSAVSQEAIEQWRFKPWTVGGEKPAELEVIAPMQFHLDDSTGLNQWLKEVKCREINPGFAHTADYLWVDLAAFRYTRAYLSSGFFQHQWTTAERLAMIKRLNRQVLSIARRCLDYPASRFFRFLPEEIRKVL
ncbi:MULTISPECIES: energy transducer TonB [unclassified Pseudomonas]|jgi:TonB family protein|uniref:energy transducer TonB n=1 Tax=unclassified Pseudomonas TaxID=196821 RepID=UPI00131FC3A0|nr:MULTISPECIES: energy transducer TonB [unclassified Pseudomonas]QHD03795.1 energy transducer TonB [Pseudomonas sp. S04]QHF36280.1 energy transducer TonB [Pseudomonas sp. S19]